MLSTKEMSKGCLSPPLTPPTGINNPRFPLRKHREQMGMQRERRAPLAPFSWASNAGTCNIWHKRPAKEGRVGWPPRGLRLEAALDYLRTPTKARNVEERDWRRWWLRSFLGPDNRAA